MYRQGDVVSHNDEFEAVAASPFRVKSLVMWSHSMFLSLLSRSYREQAQQCVDVVCLTERAFFDQVAGSAAASLGSSLPPEDPFRNLGPGDPLAPVLGMDLLYPTTDDLEIDSDYAPVATDPHPKAVDIVRAASTGRDAAIAQIAKLSTSDAIPAAEDALRWLMWRRGAYLLGEDPDGVRCIPMWAVVVDRAMSGTDFDPRVVEAAEADLAIQRPF